MCGLTHSSHESFLRNSLELLSDVGVSMFTRMFHKVTRKPVCWWIIPHSTPSLHKKVRWCCCATFWAPHSHVVHYRLIYNREWECHLGQADNCAHVTCNPRTALDQPITVQPIHWAGPCRHQPGQTQMWPVSTEEESHTLTVSQSHSLTVSQSHSFTVSRYHSVIVS